MITVICLAGAPRRVDHHEIEYPIAAELVESFLANSLLRVVRERTECSSTTSGTRLHNERVVQEPALTQVPSWQNAQKPL